MKTEIEKIGGIITTIIVLLIVCASFMIYQSSKSAIAHENTIKLLLANSFSTIIACDENQNVMYVSPNSYEMTGYTEQELMRDGLSLIMPSNKVCKMHKEKFDNFVHTNHSHGTKVLDTIVELKTKENGIKEAALRVVYVNNIFYAFLYSSDTIDSIKAQPASRRLDLLGR